MPKAATKLAVAEKIEIDLDTYHALIREMTAVQRYIAGMRHAINGLGLPGLVDANLRDAHTDLKDVISHGQSAANSILEVAETILGAAETGDAYRQMVEDKMIALMEACSFQDLTGQRLDRVSKSLMAIEERLMGFANVVKAGKGAVVVSERERKLEDWKEQNIAYGPGGADAIDQNDIDKLLSA